jgi:hypothetical protein
VVSISSADGGQARAGEPQDVEVQVIGIARQVVRQIAPNELALFDQVVDAWAQGDPPPRRRHRKPGSAVGFGIDGVLLSELVLPVIAGALAQALGTVLADPISKRRRKREPASAASTAPVAAPRSGTRGPMLTGPQAHAFHDACLSHARTMGLSPEKAALLADACLGAANAGDR